MKVVSAHSTFNSISSTSIAADVYVTFEHNGKVYPETFIMLETAGDKNIYLFGRYYPDGDFCSLSKSATPKADTETEFLVAYIPANFTTAIANGTSNMTVKPVFWAQAPGSGGGSSFQDFLDETRIMIPTAEYRYRDPAGGIAKVGV